MTWQEIIDLWAELSFYTDTSEYTPAKRLLDLNNWYKDLIAQINQDVNEDLFCDDFYFNTVAWQLEYTLPQTDNINEIPWMDNLLWVFINYESPIDWTWTIATINGSNIITWTWTTFSWDFQPWYHIIFNSVFYRVVSITSDTSMIVIAVDNPLPTSTTSWIAYQIHKVDYKKAYPERLSNLDKDQSYYLVNQPKETPFYIKYDTWVRIFPTATESVVWAGKLYWTYDVPDLKTTSTPILDDNWHYVLAIRMKVFSYQRRWMFNEAAQAQQEYQLEYRKVINTLSDSDLSPLNRYIVPLIELQ